MSAELSDEAIDAAMADATEATFRFCVREVLANEAIMTEYRRLSGRPNFMLKRHPIEVMVDEACRRQVVDPEEAKEFFDFVRDYVWLPWLNALAPETQQ